MSRWIRLIISTLFPLSVVLFFGYNYVSKSADTLEKQLYTDASIQMKKKLSLLIDEKKEALQIIGTALSENQHIKDYLLKKNLSEPKLHAFALKLSEISSLRHVWFQIINPEGISVYRSWTDNRGDALRGVRLDIAQMLKSPKITSSVSTGKYDMTFKVMVPMYEKNRFIGFIETIAKFNSIAIKMQSYDTALLIVVDKKYKQQLSKVDRKKFLDDYYIANIFPDEKILRIIREKGIENYLNIENFQVDTLNKLLLTSYKLPDIHGKDMGYFILAKELNNIDRREIADTRNKFVIFFVFMLLSVVAILTYFYFVNHQRFIRNQNKLLALNVNQKTEELQKSNEALQYQAEHDSLTALPNRVLFIDRLRQSIKSARRRDQHIGVLFLDLDKFKEVNDIYGHEVGDKLLIMVTQRLVECVRDEDTVSRLGGDEFTMIIQNSNRTNIMKIINKILLHMKRHFHIGKLDISTSFSIGISTFPEDGRTPEILLRNADTAMYRAKDSGRNAYRFYNQKMTEFALARVELEKDIKKALLNDEFEPYFQPKIDARTLKIIGLESLIRWNHPLKGMVSPAEFIPFAEEVGLIEEIDNQMIKKAMNIVSSWRKEGLDTGILSVNISTKHLENTEAIALFKEMISNIGCDTHFLELEITESQIMKDPESAIFILNELRSLGIGISIDDFGTGYSSLAYLKKLPINKLKIDKSFVDDLPLDEDAVAIVRTIISLAKNLNLELIAEGVENRQQVDFLLENGCSNFQGYYYSKPLPADACKEFISEVNKSLLV